MKKMAEDLKSEFDSTTISQIYVCSYPGCLSNFSRKDRLTIHFRTHSGEKPFVCDEDDCDKSYARAAHLKRHCETAHCQGESQPKHKCTVDGCNLQFTNKSNLKRHVELHAQKEYKCNFVGCTKSFKKHNQLRVHENEHSNILPCVCTVENCNKSFKTSSHLQRHQKVHDGYRCTEEGCTAHFEKWTQLWKHKTVAHKTEYTCEECGKVFSQQNRLSRHVKTHSEDRPVFECPRSDCSRVYLDLKSLKAHISSYHDGLRFTCADCQRTFASKQKLAQHMRLHDPDRPPPKKKPRKSQKRKSMALKLSQLGLHEDEDTQSSETMEEETPWDETFGCHKSPSVLKNKNKDNPHTLSRSQDVEPEVLSDHSDKLLNTLKVIHGPELKTVLSNINEKCPNNQEEAMNIQSQHLSKLSSDTTTDIVFPEQDVEKSESSVIKSSVFDTGNEFSIPETISSSLTTKMQTEESDNGSESDSSDSEDNKLVIDIQKSTKSIEDNEIVSTTNNEMTTSINASHKVRSEIELSENEVLDELKSHKVQSDELLSTQTDHNPIEIQSVDADRYKDKRPQFMASKDLPGSRITLTDCATSNEENKLDCASMLNHTEARIDNNSSMSEHCIIDLTSEEKSTDDKSTFERKNNSHCSPIIKPSTFNSECKHSTLTEDCQSVIKKSEEQDFYIGSRDLIPKEKTDSPKPSKVLIMDSLFEMVPSQPSFDMTECGDQCPTRNQPAGDSKLMTPPFLTPTDKLSNRDLLSQKHGDVLTPEEKIYSADNHSTKSCNILYPEEKTSNEDIHSDKSVDSVVLNPKEKISNKDILFAKSGDMLITPEKSFSESQISGDKTMESKSNSSSVFESNPLLTDERTSPVILTDGRASVIIQPTGIYVRQTSNSSDKTN